MLESLLMDSSLTVPTKFLNQVKSELKKVTWPKKSAVIKMTLIVLFVSISTGILVSGLDLLFTTLISHIIKQ